MTQALNGFEGFLLLYVAIYAACTAAVTYVGVRAMASRSRVSATALKDLLANDYYEAVTVLVPAYNSEDTIIDTVRSVLNLQHPHFDVNVVNDGSTDETLERLVASFRLVEVPIAHDSRFETRPLNVMYRSLVHANLTVVDKDHGGRSDALNAALNLARRPLVCVVDAGVVVEPSALVAPSRRFVEDESVVAVTGSVRPDQRSRRPGRWARQLQDIDHARRSASAAGWSALGAGIDAEGFVIYRRRSLMEIGGWATDTDVETLFALHRINRARNQPYRIVSSPDNAGHVQPEPSVARVIAWRARRARTFTQAMWGERHMLLRPNYGRIALFAGPARWLLDVGSCFVEPVGYAYIAASLALDAFNPGFAIAFAVATLGTRIVLTQLATAANAAIAEQARHGHAARSAAAIVEQLGVAQATMVSSIIAILAPNREDPHDGNELVPVQERIAS